jgi:hypothetical protein
MATVINDMVLEPKANPPADEGKSAGGGGAQGSAPAGPELERQIAQIERRSRERGLRLWAH